MRGPAIAENARIARVQSRDLEAIATLHAICFDEAWQPHLIERILSAPGAFGFLYQHEGRVIAFVLCRSADTEGEVLSLGVLPEVRRQGLARALMDAAITHAIELGIGHLFLEVAEDNAPARRLYETLGFSQVGRRRAYYRRRWGPSVDALTLRREILNSGD